MKIVKADFAGAEFPPETKVSFPTQAGNTLNGIVQRLFPKYARVATENGTLWKVPYKLLEVREPAQMPAMSLAEIDTLGNHLLREHEVKSRLEPGWQFGFDLAPKRGGICRYAEKQITLSVTYCLKASREEMVDTILHEMHMRSLVLNMGTMPYGRQRQNALDVLQNDVTKSSTRSHAGRGVVDVENSGNDNA